jgi:HK97 family phage portal protein
MTYWAGHDGDSYALKVESRTQGLELVPFKRGVVRPERLDDGAMVYHVADFQEPLGMRRVFHLRGFVTGWERGANTFQMSREEIGLSLAMERHAATFFKNGAVMGGVVKHPGEMSDKAYAHLKESLREEHTGENAHNWLILEENADWLPSSAEPQKSQLVEGREFQVRDHARRLRVPPHKLGDLKDATFSNIEHQAIEYVQDSLLPWALRWETAYRMQVLPVAAQVYAELLFDMLLRGDSETRSKVYTAAILNGWMTQNEARRRENLPPLAGGDELFTPLNSATTAEREAKRTYDQARSARQLVDAGYDPAAVLTTVGLPEMEWVGKPESASESEGQGSERDEPNVATI